MQTLYYSGKIEPIILSTISAPIDATIKTVDVAYGDEVHADQVLFRLETSQDDTKSTETIVEYLKLRDESLLSEHQYNSMQVLYKAGVIAKNELDESQRKRNLSAINLIKAETALAQLLPVLGMEMAAIQAVSLDDLAAINTLINMHHSILVRANTAGIFLKSGVKDPITLLPGVGVEKGQAFGVIADGHGVKITAHIPESDINKVHVGDEAIITGDAFPGHTLKGTLASVNKYVFDASNGGDVSYPVEIMVSTLSEADRAVITMGMTAKVAISQPIAGDVLVPIEAVRKDKTGLTVQKKMPAGGTIRVPVTVGKTTPSKIVIESGIEPGDTIAYD